MTDNFPPVGSVWRHARSGKLYRVTDHAVIEATGEPAVLYGEVSRIHPGCERGVTWVRPTRQFLDGRFVREDDL